MLADLLKVSGRVWRATSEIILVYDSEADTTEIKWDESPPFRNMNEMKPPKVRSLLIPDYANFAELLFEGKQIIPQSVIATRRFEINKEQESASVRCLPAAKNQVHLTQGYFKSIFLM